MMRQNVCKKKIFLCKIIPEENNLYCRETLIIVSGRQDHEHPCLKDSQIQSLGRRVTCPSWRSQRGSCVAQDESHTLPDQFL